MTVDSRQTKDVQGGPVQEDRDLDEHRVAEGFGSNLLKDEDVQAEDQGKASSPVRRAESTMSRSQGLSGQVAANGDQGTRAMSMQGWRR